MNEVFSPEDIFIPSDPKEVDGSIVVECAVVKISADGKPVVVPSKVVADMVDKKAAKIGQKLGGTVLQAKPKPAAIKDKPTSEARTKGQCTGLLAGLIVAVGLIFIIVAIIIYYFRLVAYVVPSVKYFILGAHD